MEHFREFGRKLEKSEELLKNLKHIASQIKGGYCGEVN